DGDQEGRYRAGSGEQEGDQPAKPAGRYTRHRGAAGRAGALASRNEHAALAAHPHPDAHAALEILPGGDPSLEGLSPDLLLPLPPRPAHPERVPEPEKLLERGAQESSQDRHRNPPAARGAPAWKPRSEEHTSELQSR